MNSVLRKALADSKFIALMKADAGLPKLPAGGLGGGAKSRIALCGLFLALLAVAIYWPVARQGFICYDDPDYITTNPRTQAGLTFEGLRWAFMSFQVNNWHPITWLSHMLDCQLYGIKPAGHHLTSLLFHVVNTLLVFALLRHLTGHLWRSGFVAALFAVHPLHVESVAWVSERKDVLSAFFGLLCLWAYVRWVEVATPGRAAPPPEKARPPKKSTASHAVSPNAGYAWVYYCTSLVLFALGLMSKPMLVTWPCVMLLLDAWPMRRFQWHDLQAQVPQLRRLMVEKIPFFALSLISSVVTFVGQSTSGAVASLETEAVQTRLANAVVAYSRYLGKLLWPTKLAVFYPLQPSGWGSWEVIGALMLFCGITVGVVRARRQRAYLLIGWLWFTGMLVPVIGLVQIGQQALADRYMYLPLIGLALMLAWGVPDLLARFKWPAMSAGIGGALSLGVCSVLTCLQLANWHDSKTLFQHAIDITSGNYLAHTVLATIANEEGRLEEGIAQCKVALQMAPCYPEAHNTLGSIYLKQSQYEQALASYHQALKCSPNYAEAYLGIGKVLITQAKYAAAVESLQQALKLEPTHVTALFCLGKALAGEGQFDQAIQCYRHMLVLDPSLVSVHCALGNTLATAGKPDEAQAEFLTAIRLEPKDVEAHNSLAMVLLGQGKTAEAASRLRETLQIQSTNSMANYQLALIHQSNKEIKEAVRCYRQALLTQPDAAELLNNLAWVLAASSDPSVRNGSEAVTLAERACKGTQFKEPLLLGTLAAAYAEAGRFPDAIAFAEKARALALNAKLPEVAQKNQQLLELYRAGRPYHESD